MTTIDYAMRVATQLQSENKLAQAEIILKTILEVDKTHAYALHLSGVIAYQTGKITAGIQLIQQAIASNPSIALFHSNLGEMYRQLKNIPLSIACGQRATQLDPTSVTALSNLGIAYYDAKQYDQAEACHACALAIHPNFGCSLNNMGSIYKMRGKIQQAIAFYQNAITASPLFVDPLNNLATLLLEQQEYQQALSYLEQAINLAPLFADPYCNMGLALLGLNQSDEAMFYFNKASQLKPDYAEAYYGIAKAHLQKRNINESENYIQKAISINPQQVEFHQLLAEIYHEQGNHAKAIEHLDHALTIDPTHANLYISKGTILMEAGDISNAKDQFEKIINEQTIDTRLLAHYSLVQLCKIKSDNASFQALSSISENPQEISPNKLSYLYFALGKCYDDMGEWKKAFANFTQGCNLKRKRITYNIAEQIQLTDKIIQCFNHETIEYLQQFANPSNLPIFIVGMPRSGSTLVEQILASHPDVYGAGELSYLNDLIQYPDYSHTTLSYPENIRQLSPTITNKYLTHLQRICNSAIRITDKMPNHFMAIGLIHALFPNAKIIHVKRNPIDTCLSCYTKLFSHGHYYSYDLTELGQYYHCYERIMNHWRAVLPSNAWLEINYESMIDHLEVEAKRLVDYCDLPWNPACLNFYESKRAIRTASFMQVRQPVYTTSVHRWRRFKNELAPLIKILNQAGVQLVAQQQA